MKLGPRRIVKTLYSLFTLVRNPDRLGEVFEMADALATPKSLLPIIDDLKKEPQAKRALEDKRRLHVDLDELRKLPDGTLGRVFAEHMIANGLDPKALPKLPSPDEISFFRAHLYETHDVWHAVTGFSTDWKGELGLQAFYLAQIPGPLPAALLAVGCLRLAGYNPEMSHELFDEITRGYTMGRRARPLFGLRWDELWRVPLADVRAMLGIAPAPFVKLSLVA